jgi:putative Mn2+ efflux pump MntP
VRRPFLRVNETLDTLAVSRHRVCAAERESLSFLNLLAVAVGVSADAFAVSLTQGVRARRLVHRRALLVAGTFGLFQAGMPLLGWAVGVQLDVFIAPVDHWVAFALLLAIGAKMLWEAFRSSDDTAPSDRLGARRLLGLALATSIDALAVGLSFAFLEVPILPAIALIGVVTAGLTYLGVRIGARVGTRFQTPAEIVGGVVLIGIGVKILLEHLLG